MRRAIPLLLLGMALAFAGCGTTSTGVNDRLYFGRSIPGGGEVSDAQWTMFVEEVITPRFPDGFSIFHADGAWKGDDGRTVSEKSIVFEVTHPRDPATDRKIEEIAKAYRDRFHQEAVLQLRTPAKTTLWRR